MQVAPAQLYRSGLATRASTPHEVAAELEALVVKDQALVHTPDPDGLKLQPGYEPLFLQQPGKAKGTVLMFHGYSAGPWQFRELAGRFHDAGYNVLAPRMPGHGYVGTDGLPTGVRIPRMGQPGAWDRFIDQTYARAAGLGAPIHAIGLSGGGNVALRMAERHQLAGAAAMAPYIGGDLPHGILFAVSDILDHCTFGLFGRLVLDQIPYNKNVLESNDPTPHTQGSLGQARAMRLVGNTIKKVSCPVQILTTDGDKLSGTKRVAAFLERCTSSNGWYRFGPSEQVPHAMLSPQQNLNTASVRTIHDILFNFVDQGQLAQRRTV